jgi:hypothetical protein
MPYLPKRVALAWAVRLAPLLVLSATSGTAEAVDCARAATSCGECAGMVECHWCSTTNRCIAIKDNSCGAGTIESSGECSACRTFRDCGSCTGEAHCNWCERGRKCLDENQSNLDTCPAGAGASMSAECPVVDCSKYRDCMGCAGDAACGWCGAPGAVGRCVYKGETSSCGGPHANFQSECGATQATAGYTYRAGGLTYCVPGTPDSGVVCECPSLSSWMGNPGGLGFGFSQRWGHCQCVAGFEWDTQKRECAPGCPAGMKKVGARGGSRCVCAEGAWDAGLHRCVSDPCKGGSRFDKATGNCSCPGGTLWSTHAGACLRNACPAGMKFDGSNDSCVCGAQKPAWNPEAKRCEACSAGMKWNGTECGCPGDLSWNGKRCACADGSRLVGGRCRSCENGRWMGNTCSCPGGMILEDNGCSCPESKPDWTGSSCNRCPRGTEWTGSECRARERPSRASTEPSPPSQPAPAAQSGPRPACDGVTATAACCASLRGDDLPWKDGSPVPEAVCTGPHSGCWRTSFEDNDCSRASSNARPYGWLCSAGQAQGALTQRGCAYENTPGTSWTCCPFPRYP